VLPDKGLYLRHPSPPRQSLSKIVTDHRKELQARILVQVHLDQVEARAPPLNGPRIDSGNLAVGWRRNFGSGKLQQLLPGGISNGGKFSQSVSGYPNHAPIP
jgi:hypothetical protein